MKELPDQRFSGTEIAIRFDPHAALQFPAFFRDFLLYFPEKFRRIVFDERIELRLRSSENIAGIVFQIADLTGECPCRFAD